MKSGGHRGPGGAGAGAGRRHDASAAAARSSRSRSDCSRPIGAAMIPVAFAYGGWQTASFVAGGDARPAPRSFARPGAGRDRRDRCSTSRSNFVCLKVLGPAGLAATRTPASAVMRAALGEPRRAVDRGGDRGFHAGIPQPGHSDRAARVLRHGARRAVLRAAWAGFRRAPARRWSPSCCRASLATVIALSGRYEQILNYEVSVDFISFALTAASLFVFRRRETGTPARGHLSRAGTSVHHGAVRARLRGHRGQHHRGTIPANSVDRAG